MTATTMGVEDLRGLFTSWELSLRAARRASGTLTTYRKGIGQHLGWCEENDAAPLARVSVRAWVAQRFDDDTAPATVKSRLLAVHSRYRRRGACPGHLPEARRRVLRGREPRARV